MVTLEVCILLSLKRTWTFYVMNVLNKASLARHGCKNEFMRMVCAIYSSELKDYELGEQVHEDRLCDLEFMIIYEEALGT